MAVELIKDLLKVEGLVGENTVQTIIEGDILVPDTKPDITRIVEVDGDIQVNRKESQDNKVVVEGSLRFKVLYVSDKGQGPLYSIDSSTDFKENIPIEGLTSQMKNKVAAEIEHIDFKLNNERKISVKVVINMKAQGIEENQIDVTKDLEGIDDVEVLKETLQYTDIIGINTSDALVKDAFEIEKELPEIKEVLKSSGFIIERETKITDGKVIVGGSILLEVLYISEDDENSLKTVKKEIPFTHFIEIPQIYSDMEYNLKMKIEEIYTDIKENLDGERKILEVEGIVNIEVVVMETKKQEVVVDAYSLTKGLNIKKNKVELKENIGTYPSQVLLREILDLPSNNPPIVQIFSVNVKPLLTDYNITENRVIIEGVLETTVIYSSEEALQPIYSYIQEIPFRHQIEIQETQIQKHAEINLLLQEVDYNKINGEQLEVIIKANVICEVYCLKSLDVICEIEEIEETLDITKRPSLTLYFFQEGDSLWKIAKKYNTTVQHIMAINEITDPEEVKPGDQLIIEKVYNFKF